MKSSKFIIGPLDRAGITRSGWRAAPEMDALVSWLQRQPTSFRYDGKDCWDLFPDWEYRSDPGKERGDVARDANTWTDPRSGFSATLEMAIFTDPAAVELRWRFEAGAGKPSDLITDVQSVDLAVPSEREKTVLWSCEGGTTARLDASPGIASFEIVRTMLGERALSVRGGRSSNGNLPIFYLENTVSGWTAALALAWSGQWGGQASYDGDSRRVTVFAGMQPCRFRLRPGERVAMPGALFMPVRGDVRACSNAFRRLLRDRYRPSLDNKPVVPPVSFNSWFVFNNNVNDSMLRELATEAADLGIEYFCLDAGWFDGDFPHGVGNWTVNRGKFPDGLKPVADHAHGLGMKFGLWFEPERVGEGTRWLREHPDLVLGERLVDLSKPDACDLVTDMIDGIISEVGVDWIRFDFNIDPLEIWDAAEGEDEKGLKQIRHMNGLYRLWDELMRRHPALLIEQCSSGGRRIDLETIRRGHTFWKSDDTFDQALMRFHETGGNMFLLGCHLNTNYCRFGSPGEMTALFAGPLGFGCDFRRLSVEQKDTIRRSIAVFKEIRPLIDEDYYPVFPQDRSAEGWNGWEFAAGDGRAGFFAVHRPSGSPCGSARVRLEGLMPDREYEVTDPLSGTNERRTGADLSAGIDVTLEEGGSGVRVFRA